MPTCAVCGKEFEGGGWPHVEGNSNLGVLKIENFCCESHKQQFLIENPQIPKD